MPGGRRPGGRNPAGPKKPGKKSAQDERRERRENEATKHRWRSFGFQVRGDGVSDSRAGIRVASNSTAGGAEETSSTVGIVGATGAEGGGGSGAGNTTGLGGRSGSAAGSPGSALQVVVFSFRCCHGTLTIALPWDTGHPVRTACRHVFVSDMFLYMVVSVYVVYKKLYWLCSSFYPHCPGHTVA